MMRLDDEAAKYLSFLRDAIAADELKRSLNRMFPTEFGFPDNTPMTRLPYERLELGYIGHMQGTEFVPSRWYKDVK